MSTTFYHVYEEIDIDTWAERRNPDRHDGRWEGSTNDDADRQARKVHDRSNPLLFGDAKPTYMVIAQHRVRTYPESLQDTRPYSAPAPDEHDLPA